MSPGEYKAASLGSLVVMLVVLGIWAVIWGPDEGGDNDQSPVPAVDEPADEAPDGNTDGPLIRASLPYDDLGQEAFVGSFSKLLVNKLAASGRLPPSSGPGERSGTRTQRACCPTGAGRDRRRGGGGGYPYAEERCSTSTPGARAAVESEWNVVARFSSQAEAAQTVD